VIYGHSHVPKQKGKNGVLYLNPGKAGAKRFDLPVSLGKLIVRKGRIEAEILRLLTHA